MLDHLPVARAHGHCRIVGVVGRAVKAGLRWVWNGLEHVAGWVVCGTLGPVNDAAHNAGDDGASKRLRPQALMTAWPLRMPVLVPVWVPSRALLRVSLSLIVPTPMRLSLCC